MVKINLQQQELNSTWFSKLFFLYSCIQSIWFNSTGRLANCIPNELHNISITFIMEQIWQVQRLVCYIIPLAQAALKRNSKQTISKLIQEHTIKEQLYSCFVIWWLSTINIPLQLALFYHPKQGYHYNHHPLWHEVEDTGAQSLSTTR